MNHQLEEFLRGARYILHSSVFVYHNPSLWLMIMAPALLSAAVMLVSATFLFAMISGGLSVLIAADGVEMTWFQLLLGVGALLTLGSVTMVGIVVASMVALLMAVPFLDLLSLQVEAIVSPTAEELSWSQWGWYLLISVMHTLGAFLLYCLLIGALALVSLVPIVGPPVQALGTAICSIWLLTRETMNPIMTRRKHGFFQKLQVLKMNPARTLGFGLMGPVGFTIPFLNTLVLPLEVVGGTLLYLDLELEGRVPEP